MSEPAQIYLRRRDVVAWLEPLGISIRHVDKLREAGMLKIVQLSGENGHGYYLKAQILEVVIKPFREVETGAGVCTESNSTRK
jgi:hypothetical protein